MTQPNLPIYLDFAAATPVDARVWRAMEEFACEKFYNPSAPYLPAVEVRQAYKLAKSQIAQAIGAKGDQLVITAGATESLNLAFAGHQNVVISGVEHPASLALAKQREWTVLPVDSRGVIDLEQLNRVVSAETSLVSVVLASSDLGSLQPVSQLARQIKQINLERQLAGNPTELLLHCDAAQGLGLVEVNVGRLGVDLLTISAAKIYGPKQVAALRVRPGIKLNPTIVGGGQEAGLRSGTENVAGVIGFARAVGLLKKSAAKDLARLRDNFETTLIERFGKQIRLLGHPKKRLANFSVFSLAEVDAERLIYRLESQQIYLSTGAACAASRNQDSFALTNIGLDLAERQGSLRISLGRSITAEQLELAAEAIYQAWKLERIKND